MHQCRQQLIEECLFLAEEGVGITYGTAQNATDHVACLGIGGQLAVGNGEGNSAQMVCTYAHGHVDLLLLGVLSVLCTLHFLVGHIFQTSNLFLCTDDGTEDIGIVVRMLALQHAHQTLEAHTRIDDIHRQFLECAIGLTVELHEHQVPNLNHLWVVFVYQVAARHSVGFLFGRTRVYVNLRARTAGTCVAHLPEVVVLRTVDDMIGRHMLSPELCSLIVAGDILFGRALKYGDIQILGIQFQHIHQVLPGHIDGALFEIIAKRPVAQHLEHGMMICVVSNFL